MSNAFRYTFRFCCDPGFNDETECDALMRYVKEADIDDVAVFANVEEINTGHMDEQEQEVYLALMHALKPRLAEKGVTLSVNHWHSLMHADLGKTLRPGQNFRRMVDINGRASDLCVCPLCEGWREYLAGIYARYATLKPEIVWVEDDFRYHNHDPLAWGGCFCEEHMRLYAKRAGKSDLTREEFLTGVLRAGEPHSYRKVWLDVCEEGLREAAAHVAAAVHAVSPHTKVGLMSSVPHVHAAEGRDWKALLSAFAGDTPPVNRIHLPAYQEPPAWQYLQNFNMVSMANRALIAPETEVYPELENFPYSRFAKSRRFTRFQLLSSLPLNLAGMTIDLYDLNGNGIMWEEGYQHMLKEVKPFLNAMQQTGLFSAPRRGVCVMLCEQSAYTLQTENAQGLEALYPQEVFWAGLLPAFGIPFRYCTDAEVRGETLAISGQYLRNLSRMQIKDLFANNRVLLNADALDTLCSMGLGQLVGVESVAWHAQNMGSYAYEQVTNGRMYCGISVARASAIVSCSDALEVRYAPSAQVEEYTALYTSFRKRAFAGQTLVNQKVMIFPFGRFAEPGDIPPMLRGSIRQAILLDMLQRAGTGLPMVVKSPYLAPYWYNEENRNAMYLVNASTDDVNEVRLWVGALQARSVKARFSTGAEKTFSFEPNDGECLLAVQIPSLETVLLEFEE